MTYQLGKVASKTFSRYRARAQAKIRRLKKKGFDVSNYLDFSLDKKQFNSVKDYNTWKKKIDAFTSIRNKDFKTAKNSKGMEYLGIEKRLLNDLTKIAVDKAVAEQNRLKSLKTPEGTTVGEELKVLKDENVGFIKTPTALTIDDLPVRDVLEKRLDMLKDRASDKYFIRRNTTMRENWVKSILRAFGEDADTLVDWVREMPLDGFVEMFWRFRDMRFNLYDSKTGYQGTIDPDSQLADLLDTVKLVREGRLDTDLKVFR